MTAATNQAQPGSLSLDGDQGITHGVPEHAGPPRLVDRPDAQVRALDSGTFLAPGNTRDFGGGLRGLEDVGGCTKAISAELLAETAAGNGSVRYTASRRPRPPKA